MSVIWRKVWFDLWHNKVRTLLAVLSIAVGVFAIGAIFGMVDQLLPGMDRAHQAAQPSHVTMTLTERIDRDTADRLKNIKGVKDIQVTNAVEIRYKSSRRTSGRLAFCRCVTITKSRSMTCCAGRKARGRKKITYLLSA
jgi:putative ABC transport system permease protein